MAFSQRFIIRFDDGPEVEVQASSRDMLALEKDGVRLDQEGPMAGSYRIAHAALQRLERRGSLPDGVAVPSTWDELADLADLDVSGADVEDPEGNGSGQAPTPG